MNFTTLALGGEIRVPSISGDGETLKVTGDLTIRGVTREVPLSVRELGTVKDPKLPPASADLILLVDVYHEFDYPYEMTQNMVKALKPGNSSWASLVAISVKL